MTGDLSHDSLAEWSKEQWAKTDGTFDHAKWHAEMDKPAPDVAPGTAFGLYVLDDPPHQQSGSETIRLVLMAKQLGCELQLERLRRTSATRRIIRTYLPWLAFTGFLLLALVSAATAQGITDSRDPRMIWTTPPMIGMWSPDSARVDDSLPMIASADFPPSADTALAELRACSRLSGTLDGWTLRTVATGFFRVRVWSRFTGQWEEKDDFHGFTFPAVKRIYVVQWKARDRALIKHELLHALIASHGFDPSHGTPVTDGMFKRCLPEKPR